MTQAEITAKWGTAEMGNDCCLDDCQGRAKAFIYDKAEAQIYWLCVEHFKALLALEVEAHTAQAQEAGNGNRRTIE